MNGYRPLATSLPFWRVFESTHVGMAVAAPDGVVQRANHALCEILGRGAADVAGRHFREFLHPDDVPAVEALAERLLEDDTPVRDTHRVLHSSGAVRFVEVSVCTVVDFQGLLGALVVTAVDVTDRIAAERAAVAANAAKSEFIARMSHELRTPLNSVLGFGELLAMRDLDDFGADCVDRIMVAGRHLLGLVEESLTLARAESGHVDPELEEVGLGDAMAEALDLARPAAFKRGVRLPSAVEADSLVAVADRLLLRQVLLNLLSNAVKYNRDGGYVAVTASRTGPSRVQVDVRDTGPGIEPEDLERVFEPFQRAGAERSGVEGTGLGLAISRRLTEAMGGSVTVMSTPGQGSTFTVELPAG